MLNKDVCIHCVNTKVPPLGLRWESTGKDESAWERGNVSCPESGAYASVSGDPPEWCEYKFEHGVAAGVTNEK